MSRRPQRSQHLPSTPNKRSLQSQPSTTPLAPPPSYLTNKSTTPAGPPPKSVFGSSYNPANATFPRPKGSALRSFTLPDSSPPQSTYDELPDPDHELADIGENTALELFGHNSTLSSSVEVGARGLKRSRDGRAKRQSNYTAIARSLAGQSQTRGLPQNDELVLETEHVVGALYSRELAEAAAVQSLSTVWRKLCPADTKEGGIGPATDDNTTIAAYLTTFAFQLHSPQRLEPRHGGATLPRALLDWLTVYHNPFLDDFGNILNSQPSPSANESFWDVIYSSILRGRFDRAIKLLQTAGWEHAVSALDDEATQPGYTGLQLQNTKRCAQQCIDLLASSPLRDNDWDVKGSDWALFRQRVRIASNDLQNLAGEAEDDDDGNAGAEKDNIFSRSMQGSFNFSKASRKASSKVPWTIFENLKLLYAQLLGEVDEILMTSQDWLEASVFLTVWWDGNDTADRFRSSRSAVHREKERTREVDITPLHAYRNRLADAFLLATSNHAETGFSIDSTDPAQLGLACTMEDDLAGLLSVLQSLSLPIAASFADIAAAGDWDPALQPSPRQLAQQGLDAQDLLVLSHGPQSNLHDDILLLYADLLATKGVLRAGNTEREGWEIASSVYGRLFDEALADQKIAALLDRVELDSVSRAEKVLQLCTDLGLVEQARRVAERFADSLAEANQSYGATLIFYARAHAFDKLDSTLALLTSYCLVQSTAMPPQAKIDEQLESLLGDRIELLALGEADAEAAAHLSSQLSGYATAWQFYETRDSDKPSQRRAAVRSLLSLIASASDCIRGGLFDPSVQSVVPVDGILVLLGELLPLCRQRKRVLSSQDIFAVLRVIEDVSASPQHIREVAEDVLHACKEAFSKPVPSLQKSKSDASTNSGLSGSSYELLMASSTMLSQSSSLAVVRAWDWRTGLTGISDLSADSLVLLLRTALAEELGKVWIEAAG